MKGQLGLPSMSRQAWIEPYPWAGPRPRRMYIDSSVEPAVSPAPGNDGSGVPAGYVKQIQAHDGSFDSIFQTVIPVFSGGPPPYQSPSAADGGSAPLPPNPRVGAGL